MPIPVRFQVLDVKADGALAVATDAQVVVGRRDLLGDSQWPHRDLLQTHFHGDGHYVNVSGDPNNEPDQGQWLLVVRATGRSTVVQRLTFTVKDDIVRAHAGWGAELRQLSQTAATVSIVNYAEAKEEVDAERPKNSVVTLKLYPVKHYVALACNATDATYDLFSSGRRDRLFDLGELNPGSVARLISTRRNVTQVFVKSQEERPGSWLEVAQLTPQGAGNENGILDFYRLLHEIGSDEPNSVHEAAYWGHGWHNGPVVRNTGDDSNDLLKRSPTDFDGRPKDWHAQGVIAVDFPKLKDAFLEDGRVIFGGCSHMSNVVKEALASNRKAKAGAARNEFYEVSISGSGRLNTTLDHTKRNIAQFVQATDFGRYDIKGSACGLGSYNGLAAQSLDVTVFAAPPGAEANLGTVSGSKHRHQSMKVLAPPGGENIIIIGFFRREFADDFEQDDLGYVNYTKLLSAAVPDPGWSTLRYCFFSEWELGRILRLPSGLVVQRERSTGQCNRPVAHSEGGEQGHLYVMPGARPSYVANMPYLDGRVQKMFFTKDDASMDLGLFVTNGGKTLLRIRELTSAVFEVPPRAVNLVEMELVQDPFWEAKDPPQFSPLPIGEIESVAPKCYW